MSGEKISWGMTAEEMAFWRSFNPTSYGRNRIFLALQMTAEVVQRA
jgi:hypothetical protein